MPRSVILFSGPWADVPLEALAAKAAAWGYQGFELCCWGDHLEVQHGLADDCYAPARIELLARHDLHVPVIANHKVGQAVSDAIDKRHQSLLPDYVWGDGDPAGVQERAAEEMTATFRLAERLGATVVSGFTGSPVWNYVAGYPAPKPDIIADALKQFAKQWNPILDAARECGVRFACEVHPGQLAFDLYSAEVVLDALGGKDWKRALAAITDGSPSRWDDTLAGDERLAASTAFLTRIRTCRADGRMCRDFKGPPVEAPPHCTPWYAVEGRRSRDARIIFGHWAALGLHRDDGVLGLDTGCVWGGTLTAQQLDRPHARPVQVGNRTGGMALEQ